MTVFKFVEYFAQTVLAVPWVGMFLVFVLSVDV